MSVCSLSATSAYSILTAGAPQKEKEDLDDISNELELADEDDKIPCVARSLPLSSKS